MDIGAIQHIERFLTIIIPLVVQFLDLLQSLFLEFSFFDFLDNLGFLFLGNAEICIEIDPTAGEARRGFHGAVAFVRPEQAAEDGFSVLHTDLRCRLQTVEPIARFVIRIDRNVLVSENFGNGNHNLGD